MDCASVITDIVVPFCSALLGGGLTLLGVWLTIKDQNKKEEAARKAAVRPWIFSCEGHIPKNKKTYRMIPDLNYSEYEWIAGNIKNTDNGILILDCVESVTESGTFRCIPYIDNVVEKNSAIELVIHLKNHVKTLKGLHLYIKDVYGNRYGYKIILDGQRFTLGECKEV